MRYLIIDTWNGEGYSDSGIIEDVTFTDMSEDNARYNALELARKYFGERYIPSEWDREVKVTCEMNAIHADYGSNQGAIHFKEVGDAYGLLIRPDVNDVGLLSREQFIEHYEGMLDSIEGDRDERLEFIDEMFFTSNAGAHTDNGYEILYKL